MGAAPARYVPPPDREPLRHLVATLRRLEATDAGRASACRALLAKLAPYAAYVDDQCVDRRAAAQ